MVLRLLKKMLRAADKFAAAIVMAWLSLVELPAVLYERTPRLRQDLAQRPAAGDTYAIVVKYFGRQIDGNVEHLLRSLAARGVNTVLVFNTPPGPGDIERIGPLVHRVLIRKNVGRDFGAYRAAYLRLLDDGVVPDRLLFFNDSTFYLPGPALERMIDNLATATTDVVGTFENHARHHHIGSFAFSFSGTVFSHPAIQRFWRRYWPTGVRQLVIERGEIGLSQTYKRSGFEIDVLHSLDKLADRLGSLSLTEILELRPYVSRRPRFDPVRPMQKAAQLASLAATATTEAGAGLRDSLVRAELIRQMIASVENFSQVHTGFGLYHRLLDAPLVKRDLLRQGLFAEQDLTMILVDVDPATRQFIIRDLIGRQRPISLSLVENFMRRNGLR